MDARLRDGLEQMWVHDGVGIDAVACQRGCSCVDAVLYAQLCESYGASTMACVRGNECCCELS
eukprot:6176228-Pleurochrysis_carterae.AAC.1